MTAWLVLAEADGYYSTPDNAAQTAARYEAFKAWAGEHDLRFVGVALDVEPAIQSCLPEFAREPSERPPGESICRSRECGRHQGLSAQAA